MGVIEAAAVVNTGDGGGGRDESRRVAKGVKVEFARGLY